MAADGARAAGESVRAFFAVELEAALRDEARAVVAALRPRLGRRSERAPDVRWTREEGWHVTLRFLGHFEAGRLGELIAGARSAVGAVAPFELSLAGVLALPPGRARVLALDLVPHDPLAALAAALERVAIACGFEAERRDFRPHVTLGRVRGGRLAARELAEIAEVAGAVSTGRARQPVSDVALLRSELRPSGARYTVLERIALGTDVHP